jgi:hypothetical protein
VLNCIAGTWRGEARRGGRWARIAGVGFFTGSPRWGDVVKQMNAQIKRSREVESEYQVLRCRLRRSWLRPESWTGERALAKKDERRTGVSFLVFRRRSFFFFFFFFLCNAEPQVKGCTLRDRHRRPARRRCVGVPQAGSFVTQTPKTRPGRCFYARSVGLGADTGPVAFPLPAQCG